MGDKQPNKKWKMCDHDLGCKRDRNVCTFLHTDEFNTSVDNRRIKTTVLKIPTKSNDSAMRTAKATLDRTKSDSKLTKNLVKSSEMNYKMAKSNFDKAKEDADGMIEKLKLATEMKRLAKSIYDDSVKKEAAEEKTIKEMTALCNKLNTAHSIEDSDTTSIADSTQVSDSSGIDDIEERIRKATISEWSNEE